jgi:hypothetical protein
MGFGSGRVVRRIERVAAVSPSLLGILIMGELVP